MDESPSYRIFLRAIEEKHSEVRRCFDALLQALASDDHEAKVAASNALNRASKDLSKNLANSDRPEWLQNLITITSNYAQNHQKTGHNYRLLTQLLSRKDATLSHSWSLSSNAADGDYDFDTLYQKYRDQSRLPELFQSLITSLEQLINSGEIDSIAAMNSLSTLLALLRQNQKGSYYSVLTSSGFLKEFLKKTGWQYVKAIPGLAPIATAFEETTEEFGIEVDELRDHITKDVHARLDATIAALPAPPSSGFLGHEPTTPNLPSSPAPEPEQD